MDPDDSGEWWKHFHIPEMADVLLARSDAEVATLLEFLQRELNLDPGDHIFDQCCGSGSLAIPLASAGFQVTGCDLFEPYINRAIADSADHISPPRFVCADAFTFVPDEPCDAVINWYTSFGYAADDAQNSEMLIRAFESLKPGGRFAVDLLNIPGLLANFMPVTTHSGCSAGRQVHLTRTSTLDFARGLLRQIWQWEIEGEAPITRSSAMKMYPPNRVCELVTEAGFTDARLFGSDGGQPYDFTSPRLIVVARKPA